MLSVEIYLFECWMSLCWVSWRLYDTYVKDLTIMFKVRGPYLQKDGPKNTTSLPYNAPPSKIMCSFVKTIPSPYKPWASLHQPEGGFSGPARRPRRSSPPGRCTFVRGSSRPWPSRCTYLNGYPCLIFAKKAVDGLIGRPFWRSYLRQACFVIKVKRERPLACTLNVLRS
jgi:hypothetical protein